MKKIMILFTCLSITAFGAQAQEDKDDKNDRIESYKIAFITERLDLTPKEAAAFWPVYNEYTDQMKKLKSKDKDLMKAYKLKTAPTEAEAEKFIAEYTACKQQQQELSRRYISEFKKTLPSTKVARLVALEQEFKQQLLKQLKDKKGPEKSRP